jgi:hypothetical protein
MIVSDQQMLTVLTGLKVKPGLHGEWKRISPDWLVGFFHERDRGFILALEYQAKMRSIDLDAKLDVSSKSRSQWMADKTFRLSDAALARLAPNVAASINNHESRIEAVKARTAIGKAMIK